MIFSRLILTQAFRINITNQIQRMLKLKSQLTCSYCSKIFKDPILLPCNHSICCRHLTERDVVKQNKIKCKACNEEFGVKNNDFKSNKTLKNLKESQCYLSKDEINLKQELEVSLRKFFEFYASTSKIEIKPSRTFSSISKRCAFRLMSIVKD